MYICENETIHGTTYQQLPTKGKILVSDQSSMFHHLALPGHRLRRHLRRACEERRPGGMAIVIIREDLIREDLDPKVPICASTPHAGSGSASQPPNCWAIYVCGKVFKYLLSHGGLEAQYQRIWKKPISSMTIWTTPRCSWHL